MKFVLLHEGKNDEGIRGFFAEVWELYVKVSLLVNIKIVFFLTLYTMQTMMNPFHTAHSIIRSNVFDSRVRASARKYL